MQKLSFQAAMTLAMRKDRDYFLNNPCATHYIRPFIPGEAPTSKAVKTVVIQDAPGCRRRQFLDRKGGRA